METVEDLKNDIAKSETLLKIEQQHIKEEIDSGMFDNVDEVLSNPETNDYYQKALDNLSNTPKISEKENEKKTLWMKLKQNLKKIILQ